MTEKNRFSKPVAFNNKNESDQMILEHVKRRNFSGYVKKLILADIKDKKGIKSEIDPFEAVKTDLPKTAAERLEELKKKTSQKQAR